jgi:hypothetical protein
MLQDLRVAHGDPHLRGDLLERHRSEEPELEDTSVPLRQSVEDAPGPTSGSLGGRGGSSMNRTAASTSIDVTSIPSVRRQYPASTVLAVAMR